MKESKEGEPEREGERGVGGDLRHQVELAEGLFSLQCLQSLQGQMMMMLTFGQLPQLLPQLPQPLTAYEIFTVCLPASAMRYATIFYAVSATRCCKLKMQQQWEAE